MDKVLSVLGYIIFFVFLWAVGGLEDYGRIVLGILGVGVITFLGLVIYNLILKYGSEKDEDNLQHKLLAIFLFVSLGFGIVSFVYNIFNPNADMSEDSSYYLDDPY